MVRKVLLIGLALLLGGCYSRSGGVINPGTGAAPANSGEMREVYRPPAYVERNIAGWEVRCEKDQADQSRYCSASKDDLSIGVLKRADGTLQHRVVVGGGAVYPGSTQALRIDSDAPLESGSKGFDAGQSAQIIERLKRSLRVSTRYRQAPGGDYVQRATSTSGFAGVMSFIYDTIDAL